VVQDEPNDEWLLDENVLSGLGWYGLEYVIICSVSEILKGLVFYNLR